MADLPPPPPSLLDGAALFLDFDGTLVELATEPDAIHVPGTLQPLLRRLAGRLGGRLAIISGRSIADLEAHLDCAGLAVAGSHGLELRFASGTALPLAAPDGLSTAMDEIERFAAGTPGLLVERKPAGVAVHYRRAPAQGEAVLGLMQRLAIETGLELQPGKMVAELRPAGANKGDALRAFMAEPDFAGARPVFVGDDLTDENAFAAATGLGGAGVLVGPPRTTAAVWRLNDVAAAAAWLERAAQ